MLSLSYVSGLVHHGRCPHSVKAASPREGGELDVIIIMLFVMNDCTSIVCRKYIGLIQYMYLECETLVPSTSGESSNFMMDVVLHQGSALNPFLFIMVMDVFDR